MAFVASCGLASLANLAFAGPHAHTHGEAQAQMVLDRNLLSIEVTLPMDVLVGFERAPRNDTEKQRWNQALDQLSQTQALWSLPAAAACKAQAAQTQAPHWGHSEHTDVVINYAWQCDKPQALDKFQTQFFERFKRLRLIELEHVTPKGQGKTKLTAQKPVWTAGAAP